MKKYLISKVYLWVDIVVILFAVSGIVVSGMSFKNFLGWEDREVDVGLILIFVHILSWYMLVAIIIDLFKFPIGCYTLNKEGVTLYVGQKNTAIIGRTFSTSLFMEWMQSSMVRTPLPIPIGSVYPRKMSETVSAVIRSAKTTY